MTSIYIHADTALPARRENDLYRTERTLIHAALQKYANRWATSILDIGAGDGRWGAVAKGCCPDNRVVCGVELTAEPCPCGFTHWHSPCDFLRPGLVDELKGHTHRKEGYDLVLSNPPYAIAEECVLRGFELLAPGGTMIFLLRLAFQAGMGRYKALWLTHSPVEVGVLSRRPSFYGGGTNGTDYGLYVWRKTIDGVNAGNPRSWKTSLIEYERDKQCSI